MALAFSAEFFCFGKTVQSGLDKLSVLIYICIFAKMLEAGLKFDRKEGIAVALILSLIPLALIIFCAVKESKVTGLYKTFGVYGRFYAYMTVTFLAGGLVTLILTIAMVGSQGFSISSLATSALLVGIGILMYLRARAKCPAFLRRKLLVSMFVTGFGVATKIVLFFIGAVWTLTGPKEVTLENGRTAYVYDGEVYYGDGVCVGTISGNDTFKANANYSD